MTFPIWNHLPSWGQAPVSMTLINNKNLFLNLANDYVASLSSHGDNPTGGSWEETAQDWQ